MTTRKLKPGDLVQLDPETIDKLDDLLYAAGWRSVADAQHAGLRDALPKIFAMRPAVPHVTLPVDLRDYFAAKAMQADLANTTTAVDEHWRDGIAVDAYKMADAMLQARAQ